MKVIRIILVAVFSLSMLTACGATYRVCTDCTPCTTCNYQALPSPCEANVPSCPGMH